jgi:putative oxidoreductase
MAAPRGSVLTDLGKLILRVIIGFGIATHGWSKLFTFGDDGARRIVGFTGGVAKLGFPYPEFFAWAAAISEFGGGICLGLGFLTRFWAAMIAITMMVALYRHRPDPFARKELALAYLAPALFTLLSGPGRFSIDAIVFKRK